jgi:hypothetical protein
MGVKIPGERVPGSAVYFDILASSKSTIIGNRTIHKSNIIFSPPHHMNNSRIELISAAPAKNSGIATM